MVGVHFGGCSSLTSVVILDSVEEIEQYAFLDWTQLEEVTLGTGLINIAEDASAGCPQVKIKAPSSIQELMIKSGIDLSIVEWY